MRRTCGQASMMPSRLLPAPQTCWRCALGRHCRTCCAAFALIAVLRTVRFRTASLCSPPPAAFFSLLPYFRQPVHTPLVPLPYAQMLGRDPREAIVHKGDADENKITWVPPSFSGLSNSTVVTCKTQHWNKDGDAAVALSAAPAGSTVTPTGGTAMAADGATKENAPVVSAPMAPC